MTFAFGRPLRPALLITSLAVMALLLAGCASGTNAGVSGTAIIIGTVGQTPALDPAGPSDQGSLTVQAQLYSRLMATDPRSGDIVPDLADSAKFTNPTTYTVRLHPHARFANGHSLSSSDVKFSLDRQRTIKDPLGPSQTLVNLVSITTPDRDTVVFHLKVADRTFDRVLASEVGTIVDQQVFSATALTPNDVIVRANAFDGQYRIDSYHHTLITLASNQNYAGRLGAPKTSSVALKFYSRSADARLDLQAGTLDVAYGLSGSDVALAKRNQKLTSSEAAGSEIRFLIFNMKTMPFGSAQSDADAAKALAIRQAAADLVDRGALAASVYAGTALPLYSVVPLGQTGTNDAYRSKYGSGLGGADLSKAQAVLQDAGVALPVPLTVQFTPEQFGAQSAQEFALLRDQLETGGLFKVELQYSAYSQFIKGIAADGYAAYQGNHVASVEDPSDALALFGTGDLLSNHFSDPTVSSEIDQAKVEPDATLRLRLIQDIQQRIAAAVPVIPLLQSEQIALTSKSVSGVAFDASSGLRFGSLVAAGR